MLTLSNLKPKDKRKARKRVGRGTSSGHGAYSGRGIKGQKARTGGGIRPGFEGGRMPLIRQMPKSRGFRSPHKKNQVVNLLLIEKSFKLDETVTPENLQKKGLIENVLFPVKILGKGAITKKLEFKNVKVSATAKAAIEKSGGRIV